MVADDLTGQADAGQAAGGEHVLFGRGLRRRLALDELDAAVVQRALPPQACSVDVASCSTASTSRFPSGTSTGPNPSTVSLGIRRFGTDFNIPS